MIYDQDNCPNNSFIIIISLVEEIKEHVM